MLSTIIKRGDLARVLGSKAVLDLDNTDVAQLPALVSLRNNVANATKVWAPDGTIISP